MAEKLLIMKSLGYVPNDMRWRGFRVDEARAVLMLSKAFGGGFSILLKK
jgi:hypothetical protein